MHTPIRLLIADDSEIIRRAICVLLQAQTGIAVCGEAQDYADLLEKLSVSTYPGGAVVQPRDPANRPVSPVVPAGSVRPEGQAVASGARRLAGVDRCVKGRA